MFVRVGCQADEKVVEFSCEGLIEWVIREGGFLMYEFLGHLDS